MTPLLALTLRARLKEAIRAFFSSRQYLEVDTPVAVICPGTEVHLRYFATTWRDLRGTEHSLYLRSSPELHMKQALALGAPRVFQLATCFRNGGELSAWHHPEFTMLEWYESGVGFSDFIDQTEALMRHTAEALAPDLQRAGLSPKPLPQSFERITVRDAFKRWAKVDLVDRDPDLAAQGLASGSVSLTGEEDFETAFFKLLLERVEPGLSTLGGQGAVLHDFPPSQAALAKVTGGVAKRFEFYLNGVELCNGFEELLSEELNRQRIGDALALRRTYGYEIPAEDDDFYLALGRGLAPCCGNALGFDRWLAIVTGAPLPALIPFRQALPYRLSPPAEG